MRKAPCRCLAKFCAKLLADAWLNPARSSLPVALHSAILIHARSSLPMAWLNPARKLLAGCIVFCDSDSYAKLRKPISRNHCPTRHTCPTRPTSPSASREAQRPPGGAASPLPAIRRHTGNEDVAPPVWLNPARAPCRLHCILRFLFMAKLLADGVAKSCAKLRKPISRNHSPTRHTRPTRPTSPSASREAQSPLGGAASPLPAIRRCAGNEDVAHPVWLNPVQSSQSKFQETIVPRVLRVPFVPPRYRQSAKLTGRRFAALEPSGAAGWAAKVLHGTPEWRSGIRCA